MLLVSLTLLCSPCTPVPPPQPWLQGSSYKARSRNALQLPGWACLPCSATREQIHQASYAMPRDMCSRRCSPNA